MILTAYLDESGTHDGDADGTNPPSTHLVMACMMGNASQWQKFQYIISRLKKSYNFDVFHTIKFKNRKAEFKGWSEAKQLMLVSDLTDAIADNLMEGCVITLDRKDFREKYLALSVPKKTRLDTEYGLCFRACVKHMVDDAVRRLGHHKKFAETRLNVVLEDGAKNRGDAKRIFFQMKEAYRTQGIDILGEFTLARKNERDPILAADFLAHTIWANNPKNLPSNLHEQNVGTRQGTGLTHLGFEQGALEAIREVHIGMRDRPVT